MITRTYDVEKVNKIVNDPSIFSMITMDGFDRLDMSVAMNDDNLFLIVNDNDGLFMFIKTEDRVYDLHTNLLPSCRGKKAILAFKEAKEYMRQHGAKKLTTVVPIDNPAADWIARAVGFQFEKELTIGFIRNGVDVPLKFYSMEI